MYGNQIVLSMHQFKHDSRKRKLLLRTLLEILYLTKKNAD